MDLIKQLIQNKQNKNDIETLVVDILDEIIKYERLRKSPKFTHIIESPALQKQLPNIWQAFQKDSQKMFLFENIMSIVQNVSDQQVQLYLDYQEQFTKREKRNLEIIGNPNQIQFLFKEFSEVPSTLDLDAEYLILTNKTEEYHLASLILFNDKKITSYTGEISDTEEIPQKVLVEPYVNHINNLEIIINSYSIQGNNDYNFGSIEGKPIKIDNNIFYVGDESIELTDEDNYKRQLIHTDIEQLAEYLIDLYEKMR